MKKTALLFLFLVSCTGHSLAQANAGWDEIKISPYHKDFGYAKKNGKTGLYNILEKKWNLEPLYDSIIKREDIEYLSGFYFVYLNGTAGLYCINGYPKNESWLIPIGRYHNINQTTPKSTFLFVDSAGKTGVWQYENDHMQRAWPVIAADDYSGLEYNKPANLIYLKKGDKNGVLSGAGWLTAPDDKNALPSAVSNTWLFRYNKVIIDYNKGIGFKVTCLTVPYPTSIAIADPVQYDSVYMKEYILYGVKNKKTTAYLLYFELWDKYTDVQYARKTKDGLEILRSELLVADADSVFKLPLLASKNAMIELPPSLLYFKNEKWNSLKLQSENRRDGIRMVAAKTNFMADKWEKKYQSEYENLSLFLVATNGKWGIVNTEGKIFVPLVHNGFKFADSTSILFKSPVKDQWRFFSSANSPYPENFHPEWGALRVFVHNNLTRADFTSRKLKGVSEMLLIDNKEYFIHNGFTNLPAVEWYTSQNPLNKGITGDVTEAFSIGKMRYYIRKTPTGAGIYRGNSEIIPPFLVNITQGLPTPGQHNFTKLVLTDKRYKSDYFINADQFNSDFKSWNFIVQSDKLTCSECNGRGGENFTGTKTIQGETTYSSTKTTTYTDTYEKVWDSRTNGQKTIVKTTPKTTYNAKTVKAPDKKVIVSGFSKCTRCKGLGYLTDAKFHGSITSNGLSIISLVDLKNK